MKGIAMLYHPPGVWPFGGFRTNFIFTYRFYNIYVTKSNIREVPSIKWK